jgi:hypothetical protein
MVSTVDVIPSPYAYRLTHSRSSIDTALALRDDGLSATAIGWRLGIPRSTVKDWLAGRVPSTGPGNAFWQPCCNWSHDSEALPPPYVYLLGLYLGDGCIASHARGVYRLRLTLDAAYPRIVDEAASAIQAVMPANRVGRLPRRYGDVELYCYSKAWPCLFPQHGPGKKHLRPIALTEWQEELVRKAPELLLRGLIHSDGCRFMNTGRKWRHPRYAFSNFSPDIKRIFTDACDLLALRWTTAGRKTIYVSRKADVARMDQFIGPKA